MTGCEIPCQIFSVDRLCQLKVCEPAVLAKLPPLVSAWDYRGGPHPIFLRFIIDRCDFTPVGKGLRGRQCQFCSLCPPIQFSPLRLRRRASFSQARVTCEVDQRNAIDW